MQCTYKYNVGKSFLVRIKTRNESEHRFEYERHLNKVELNNITITPLS